VIISFLLVILFEDGIEIEGVGSGVSQLNGAVIHCYDDHRIAMSFAVIGCRVPGIIIEDKDCVDKVGSIC